MAAKQKTDREIRIDLLQENLGTIRKLAGWTMEQLGESVGVAKQTIGNLESKKTDMTFCQWFTLRWVLETEQKRQCAEELEAIAAEFEQLELREAEIFALAEGEAPQEALRRAVSELRDIRSRRAELADKREAIEGLAGDWRKSATAELMARLRMQSSGRRWKKQEQSCLGEATWLLLDNPFSDSPLSERDYREVQSAYEVRAAAASSVNFATLSKIFSATVGTVLTGAGIGLMTAAGWSLAKSKLPAQKPPVLPEPEEETQDTEE